MKKIILSFMILSAIILSSCVDDSTPADIATYSSEIDITADTTTQPTETHISTMVTTAKTALQISESDLWIVKEYEEDIERISEFANKKLLEYYDFMEDEFIPEIPDVYLLISDMNFDGSPEIITGHSIKYREQKLYELYSYELEYKGVTFLVPITVEPFGSKIYIDNSGMKYFSASIYSGSNGTPDDVWFLSTRIWYKDGKWNSEDSQTKSDTPSDKYEYILIASVEIDPGDIKGSVEQCFIEYYSQIYDKDGNRLVQ